MSYFPNPKQLAQGQLSNAATTLYTAASAPTQGPAPKTIITEILLCNLDTSARTFSLYAVPSGGSAANSNTIFSAEAIAANTTRQISCALVLEAGATLRGAADTTLKVTYTVSGLELTS